MTTPTYTSALKALRDASEPLSTATLAQSLGVDEMAVHLRLRRLYGLGKVERKVEAGEALWSYVPPPKVKKVKPRRLTHRGNHTYKRICPTCKRPFEGV